MGDEVTIKIKREDLWKYSTFILAAVVVVGIIWIIAGGNSNGTVVVNNDNAAANNAANNNAAVAAGGTIDMEVFSDETIFPALGPKNAKTTVVEFADFQCPYCAIAAGVANWTSQYSARFGDFIGVSGKLKEAAEAGDIRFIYVPMAFLGQESTNAAEAALCANEQGKFWELHDILYGAHDMQENNGKFDKNKIIALAADIDGLNQASFKSCLEGSKRLADAQKASQTANAQGVSATPSFFVNGQKASPSWAAIEAKIE